MLVLRNGTHAARDHSKLPAALPLPNFEVRKSATEVHKPLLLLITIIFFQLLLLLQLFELSNLLE